MLNDIMQARKPPRASLGVGSRRPSRVVLVKGHSGGHSRCSLRAVWATVARGGSHIAGRASATGPQRNVGEALTQETGSHQAPPSLGPRWITGGWGGRFEARSIASSASFPGSFVLLA